MDHAEMTHPAKAATRQVHTPAHSERLDAVELQHRYYREIYRYVARRIYHREDAEDVTMEVFAAAFAGLAKFRYECDPRLWLLAIARREVLTAVRRSKTSRETAHSQLDNAGDYELFDSRSHPHEEPGAALERAEACRALGELMGLLKDEQAEVLRLRYWEELSINEIAVVLKKSPAACNSLLQRARATLLQRGRQYFLDSEVLS
jgi:RNA polymerase sigma-70 factor (ECF subfamily)